MFLFTKSECAVPSDINTKHTQIASMQEKKSSMWGMKYYQNLEEKNRKFIEYKLQLMIQALAYQSQANSKQ